MWIIIFVFILMILLLLYRNKYAGMIIVKSNIDNIEYLVRNTPDKQSSANILAKLRNIMNTLNDFLVAKLDTNEERYNRFKPYILLLNSKIKNIVFEETPLNTDYTSYTVNKGDKIVFCIRAKIPPYNFHDINIITYVLLHELSHIACPEYNHTELFKHIFKFICQEAINLNIYKKVDFYSYPQLYCGMTINDSII